MDFLLYRPHAEKSLNNDTILHYRCNRILKNYERYFSDVSVISCPTGLVIYLAIIYGLRIGRVNLRYAMK